MKSRIGIAGLIWSGSLLLSRVIGLVRERVLGTTLGVGGEADVYQTAFRIPDLINHLVAGGALSIVFIPLFTAHLERGDEARAWRSFSLLANFLVAALGSLVFLGMIGMPQLVKLVAPGFSPEQLEQLTHLSRIVLPAQLFHLLGGLLSAALLSKDRHAVPALAPLLYTGCIIVGGLWTGTAEGFAWGVLVGAALGPFGLPLWACLKEGLQWHLVFDPKDPDFRAYLFRSLPIMLGWSIIGMDETVTTWFASSFQEGSVAILGYARTLMKVPMGVFGMAMGIAAYPTLTRLCAEGRTGEAWKTLSRASKQVLILALGSQVILTVAGPEIGSLVYSARKIQADQLREMGICLGIYSLALWAWTVQTLLSRGFYARGKTWLPTWMGVGVLVLTLPLYSVLARYGSTGLAMASSLGVSAYTLLLGGVLWWEIGRKPGSGDAGAVEEAGFGRFFLKAGLAAGLGIGAGLGLAALWPMTERGSLFLLGRMAMLGGVGGTVFLGVGLLLGIAELRELAGRILRRIPVISNYF